jgi:hypothetical protein
MLQDVKLWIGNPAVLTTIEDVTIDETHKVEFANVGEETEYDVTISDDASGTETTTFIGISVKR